MRITVSRLLFLVKGICVTLIVLALYQSSSAINQAERQDQQRNTNKQVATSQTPLASVSPVSEQPKAANAGNGANNPVQVTIVDSRSRAFEWASLAFNFVLLLIVGYQAWTYKKQLAVMTTQEADYKRQAEIMDDSLTETRNLVKQNAEMVTAIQGQLEAINKQEGHLAAQVDAAKDAAKMAENQLLAMQGQWKAMDETLEEQRKIVGQNERSVRAAEDNAKTARDAFYVGEAPYFGIVDMNLIDFTVGYAPRLAITFMNGGKTPAWLFRASPVLICGDLPTTGDYWHYFPLQENIADSFVPSGVRKTITYRSNDFRYTAEQKNAVETDETSYIFVVLTLTYRDFRKRDHKRVFQYIWNRTDGCFMDFETTNDTPPE